MSLIVKGYCQLIEAFLKRNISAQAFETEFLRRFKNEQQLPNQEFSLLDELFGDVDMFCADDELRDADELDEQQLRSACARTLEQLRKMDSYPTATGS